MAYWLFKYGLFTPLLWVLWRPKITGAEGLPKSGGAILAANHQSAWDTILLPAFVRRRVTFPAKAELFVGHDTRSRLVAWFLKVIGQVPVDRSGGRASADSLRPLVEALDRGAYIGIFPEGTRTPDGNLYKGKTGVARLAVHANVPVIPVGLHNTVPRRGPFGIPLIPRVELRFGAPRTYAEYAGREEDRAVLRYVTDDVMAAIQRLTGQRYVDLYGSTVKRKPLPAEELARQTLPDPHATRPEVPPPNGA